MSKVRILTDSTSDAPAYVQMNNRSYRDESLTICFDHYTYRRSRRAAWSGRRCSNCELI